jgi:hypothetical protein
VYDSNNKDGLMHFHGLFTENTRNVRFKVLVHIPDGKIQQNSLHPTALRVSRNHYAFNLCIRIAPKGRDQAVPMHLGRTWPFVPLITVISALIHL